DGHVAARVGEASAGGADLEAAGHPHEVDAIGVDAVATERVVAAGDELLDDGVVEPRRDDGEAAARVDVEALDDVHGSLRTAWTCGVGGPSGIRSTMRSP